MLFKLTSVKQKLFKLKSFEQKLFELKSFEQKLQHQFLQHLRIKKKFNFTDDDCFMYKNIFFIFLTNIFF